jgi:DNA topoisomerase-3
VHEHGSNYVCSKAVPTAAQPTPSCTFKSGKIILQQPVEREQMTKLLATGKTDLLENFVSNKTRRKFKAFLAFDKKEGKVSFEFQPRAAKAPPAKAGAAKTAAAKTADAAEAKKTAPKPSAKNAAVKKAASKKAA